jgi:hypothetical protein
MAYVADVELADDFDESIAELDGLDLQKLNAAGERVYEPGKWTIKEIFQHIGDSERVLAYRALRIGRNDKTELPGFDEQLFGANVSVNRRSLKELSDELKLLRVSTKQLYASFSDEALQRDLVINGNQMSALAYGFTIIGHQKHHLRIIEEKYL